MAWPNQCSFVFCCLSSPGMSTMTTRTKSSSSRAISDSEAVFEHQPLFAPPLPVVVKDQLSSLKKWKLTKKEPTMLCPQSLCKERLAHNVLVVQKDIDKAAATQLLMEAYMSNKVEDESLLAFAKHSTLRISF